MYIGTKLTFYFTFYAIYLSYMFNPSYLAPSFTYFLHLLVVHIITWFAVCLLSLSKQTYHMCYRCQVRIITVGIVQEQCVTCTGFKAATFINTTPFQLGLWCFIAVLNTLVWPFMYRLPPSSLHFSFMLLLQHYNLDIFKVALNKKANS